MDEMRGKVTKLMELVESGNEAEKVASRGIGDHLGTGLVEGNGG